MMKYFQLPPRHAEQDSEQIGDEQEISFQGILRKNGQQTQLLLWASQDQGLQVLQDGDNAEKFVSMRIQKVNKTMLKGLSRSRPTGNFGWGQVVLERCHNRNFFAIDDNKRLKKKCPEHGTMQVWEYDI